MPNQETEFEKNKLEGCTQKGGSPHIRRVYVFTEVSLPSRETVHCKGQGPGEGPQRRGHRSELKDCFMVIKMKRWRGSRGGSLYKGLEPG